MKLLRLRERERIPLAGVMDLLRGVVFRRGSALSNSEVLPCHDVLIYLVLACGVG